MIIYINGYINGSFTALGFVKNPPKHKVCKYEIDETILFTIGGGQSIAGNKIYLQSKTWRQR